MGIWYRRQEIDGFWDTLHSDGVLGMLLTSFDRYITYDSPFMIPIDLM